MIFKVTYQETKLDAPRRETTRSLYMEAANKVEVRKRLEENTSYNIEYIQALDPAHLAYEQQNPDFSLTEF